MKKLLFSFFCGAVVSYFLVTFARPETLRESKLSVTQSNSKNAIVVEGKTQCIPERKGVIAPDVLQPVTGILVSLGDKVKKGQPLVQLRENVVTAPVDGVVNRLEVYPGMVSNPGTVWGEILDITVIEVMFHLTASQSDLFKIGDEADVLRADSNQSYGKGQIVFIDQKANSETGKIAARLHLVNPEGKLRCGVAVQVRFPQTRANNGIKGKISNEEHKP